MSRIAYIAPEIPALSATFVYNEILALQEKGFEVLPISVHLPASEVSGDRVKKLQADTLYLYQRGLGDFLFAALLLLFISPRKFLKGVCIVSRDANAVGSTTRLGIGLFYRFLAACRVACTLNNEGCVHLHAHFAHVPTDIAMYAAVLAGIPYSFTAHANDLFERKWLLPEKINRAAFVVTISDFNRKFMVSCGGDLDKIHIVRCGVDTTRFAQISSRPLSRPYKIGSIGRMVEKKGFETLIGAAAHLRSCGVEFCLTIAGDGPLRDKLLKKVEGLGLSDITNFPGPVASDQMPKWLRSLDLFVLPCQQDSNGDMDGIPVVLMEAMACGVPVVSTCISGIPELITHRKEGLLVKPKAEKQLSLAITELLHDRDLYASLKNNGQDKVNNEFEENKNISRLIRLLSAKW